ncbi:MAG: right-handed parallel beta-helix repeat-containing protein [Nitrospirae bacterium]|nr:right-handed parallel beta-helix repeat-containing protein [Nitrospirota bacterium]
MKRSALVILVAVFLSFTVGLIGAPAEATDPCAAAGDAYQTGPTFTVTRTDDVNNFACCAGTGGIPLGCSLREAINAANSLGGTNDIIFESGLSGTITVTSALPPISGTLTITGPATPIIINGNSFFDIFYNGDGTSALSLVDLTLQDGVGGIYVGPGNSLIIDGCTFTGNNNGVLTGGAVDNDGSVSIVNSTFHGNSSGTGGAIYNSESGTLIVYNSTFSNNSATTGGGIYNAGSMSVYNSVIANSNSGGDCANTGTISAQSNNLVEDGSCSSAYNGDPVLGVLANNGGPTQTMALEVGSPAIDAGQNSTCAATDQRGTARPQGVNCDIGAYEKVVAVPPGVPTLASPASGALVATTTPSYTWTVGASAGATQYRIYLARQSAGGVPGGDQTFNAAAICTGTTAGDTCTVNTPPMPTLTNNTTYFWQVRGINAAGAGAWTAQRQFIVTTSTVPGVPTITSPAEGEVLASTTPTYTWTVGASAGATQYRVYLARKEAGVLPGGDLTFNAADICTGTTAVDTCTVNTPPLPTLTLNPSYIYFFRVRGINAAGAGEWAGPRKFKVVTVPGVPTLTSPASGALVATTTPSYTWTVGASGLAAQYRIYLTEQGMGGVPGGDLTFNATDICTGTAAGDTCTVNTPPMPTLTNDTTYFWQVRGINDAGSGEWTAQWQFIMTTSTIPDVPILMIPASWSTIATTTPSYTWKVGPSVGATQYRIYLAQSGVGGVPGGDMTFNAAAICTGTTADDTCTVNAPPMPTLSDGINYDWTVRGITVAGAGAWVVPSIQFTVTTATVPGVPTLTSPASGAVIASTTPSYTWTIGASAGATQYRIYLTQSGGGIIPGGDLTFNAAAICTGITAGDTCTVNTPPMPTLTNNTTYSWNVRGINAAGAGAWAGSRLFTVTTATVPGVPTPTSPIGGIIVGSTTPSYTWTIGASAGATQYRVYLTRQGAGVVPGGDRTFNAAAICTGTTAVDTCTVNTPPMPTLTGNTTYFWNLRGSNAAGSGAWAGAQQFKTP